MHFLDRNSVYLGCNPNFANSRRWQSREYRRKDRLRVAKEEEAILFREYDRQVIKTHTPEYHIIEHLPERMAYSPGSTRIRCSVIQKEPL